MARLGTSGDLDILADQATLPCAPGEQGSCVPLPQPRFRGSSRALGALAEAGCDDHDVMIKANGAAMQRRIIGVGEARLECTFYGSGEALILLANAGCSTGYFDHFARRLAPAGFQIVAINMRGVGESTGPLEGIILLGDVRSRYGFAAPGTYIDRRRWFHSRLRWDLLTSSRTQGRLGLNNLLGCVV